MPAHHAAGRIPAGRRGPGRSGRIAQRQAPKFECQPARPCRGVGVEGCRGGGEGWNEGRRPPRIKCEKFAFDREAPRLLQQFVRLEQPLYRAGEGGLGRQPEDRRSREGRGDGNLDEISKLIGKPAVPDPLPGGPVRRYGARHEHREPLRLGHRGRRRGADHRGVDLRPERGRLGARPGPAQREGRSPRQRQGPTPTCESWAALAPASG